MTKHIFTLPKILVRFSLVFIMVLAFGQAWGQTIYTFTLNTNTSQNWTTASWTISPTATNLTYPGDNAYTGYNAADIHNVVINLTSTTNNRTITLNASIASLVNSVTINNSSSRTLTLTIGNNTLTMSGDLSGDGTLTFGTGTLNIGGGNMHAGTFTQGTGTVNYNGSVDQQLRGGITYYNLTISGGSDKTLSDNTTVSNTLTLTNGNLVTGSNYLHITNTATGAISGGNNSSYVQGTLRRTLAANIGANGSSYAFPIGESGGYNTLELINVRTGGTGPVIEASITSTPAATTGDATITSMQPRNWYLHTVSGTYTSGWVKLTEPGYLAGSAIGQSSSQSGTYTSLGNTLGGDYLQTTSTFAGSSLPAYFAIGTPIIPTLYSYQNGNWNNSAVWTLDPSGTTWYNPSNATPTSAYNVVILNGRTVTATADVAARLLTIIEGGIFDLATFIGTFGTDAGQGVDGSGVFRIKNTVFPTGDFSVFTATGGGTIEYYDVTGNLPTQATYNNLWLTNSSAANNVMVFTNPSNPTNYTINGNLEVSRTGTGTLTLTLGSANINVINLTEGGNVTIGTGCTFNVRTDATNDPQHTLTCSGDFINKGTVDFNNGTDYCTPGNTGGAVILTFIGQANNTVTVNTTTTFYDFRINKGTDQTYVLSVIGSVANCNPFKGYYASGTIDMISGNFTIVIQNGTIRLGENIANVALNASGNGYFCGTNTNGTGCLWIDGATVATSSTYFAVYGKLRISNGSLTANQIIFRQECEVFVEGGTITAGQIRNSAADASPKGAYVQTGGVVTINASSTYGGYTAFSMEQAAQAFKMTGGILNVSSNGDGGIEIRATNTEVTGGTINAYATNNTFTIYSTAPFYNLNMYRTGSANLSQSTTPLIVKNKLYIDGINTPTYTTNNLNVTVGGDFILSNGATYVPGTNTTTFNGASGQEFQINGAITGGLQNLTLSNTTATVITATIPKTLTINGTLTISALCSLEDYGNIISAKGTVYNAGTHISNNGGAGKIVLSGTTTQQIQGDGNGIFGNLELNNSVAAGTDAARFYANQTITNVLTLTSGILNIDKYRLNLYNNTTGAISVTSPSANKMIKTAGNQSDGGVLKIFDADPNNTFTYPVGTTTGYSPATLTVNATGMGNIIVKPVGSEQPYATVANNPLKKYWKLESEYFSGITSVVHQYTYVDPEDIQATKTDANFYRAICKNYAWADLTTLSAAEKTANQINFTTTYIDGDYTAGDLTAFTPIVTYYSKKDGNWSDVATWSTSSHNASDPDPATPPTGINPVVIGDGSINNHTVTITANSAIAGSLQLNAGSVLDCGTYINHDFGMLPNQVIGGAGKLRISRGGSNGAAQFPAGDFGTFIGTSGGIVEYYTNGYNLTLPTTSYSTALSLANYCNLNLMAGGSNTITLPNIDMVVYKDLTTGGSGFTNNVLLNATSARSLTVNNNLNVNAGLLQFQNGTIQTLTVGADVNIANGATFNVANSAAVTNVLSLSGSITNNGTLNFRNGTGICNLTFKGNTDNLFTGTNASASTTLNMLTINKGTTQTPVLTMDVAGTLTTLTNNWLTLTNGTFRFAKNGQTITLTNTTTNPYTIPATACLSVDGNTTTIVNISNVANSNSDLMLAGKLEVLSGIVNIGRPVMTDANNNDIEYSSAGTPEINIGTNGMLNINGQIRYSTQNTSGSLIYIQTGGAVTIYGRGADVTTLTRAKLAVHNTGSIFNMSGGTITIKNGSGTTYSDLYLRPDNSSVTGGTIIFDATSMGNQTYKLDADVPLYNLTLTGTTSNTVTLNQTVSDLQLLGNLSIDAYSTYNSNNLDLAVGGNFTKSGDYNHGTNTTTFNGSSTQDITLNNSTTFYNLTINKPSGTASLLGTADPVINNIFTLEQGTLDTKNRMLEALSDVVNSGTHVSTGAGYIYLHGTVQQTISGNGEGSFANLTLNNLRHFVLDANITITKQLHFQNGMLHLDDNLLTFSNTALDPIGIANSRFITTNGVSSDGGIRKMLVVGNNSFTLPIGALASGTNKYTPVSYTITNAAGANPYIQVRPVNAKHYATTDNAATELTYFWNVTVPDDFTVDAMTQVFTYLQADVKGNELAYISGRLPYSELTWIKGVLADISDTPEGGTITFTNISKINGNYTAGETNEFGISPRYRSRASGNWNANTTWEKNTDGTGVGYNACLAGDYPIENQVFIQNGHTVTATANGYKSIYLNLEGELDLGTTNSHNFISLVGNGRLKIDQNNFNAFIFPGGENSVFMNTTNSTIEYYSANPAILPIISTYQNLDLSGAGTKAIPNLELTIKGNITFMTGCGQVSSATYNRNINLNGNWVNNTANQFVPGTCTIFFNGTAAQQIGGSGSIVTPGETYYNVVVNNPAGLTLGREISILNNLTINSGSSLAGSSYTLNIKGNWTNNSNTKFIASTSTVNFNGTTNQTYLGATGETFNNITINNTEGVTANCATTLNGNLTFVANNGKLMIGAYPLTLTNTADNIIAGAGASKFIQTNGLPSDAGVIKSVTGAYNFKFEIGTGSKYTPAQFNETGAGGTGTIKVIPVKTKHPFANNNLSDELKYYWIVQAGGSLTPTTITHTYTFVAEDAVPNATGYVTGRFYNGNWAPVGGGEASTTVLSPTMTFTTKAYLNGEYTCGLASNFKTVSIYYSRDNAPLISSGADWRNLKTWSTKGHSDNIYIPNTIPNANSVIIKSGHKVVSYDDGITISDLTLNGELNVNATASHDFGSVTGTGKLIVKNNASKVFVLPTANYNSFTASTGGTIEYNGDGDLPSQNTYNNLILSATGAKNLPNQNMVINGNLQITNGQLNNGFGKDIDIKKNWVDNVAGGGFTSLAGKVVFNGVVAQTITINGAGKFYNLEINNTNGLTLNTVVEVANQLILTAGKINTAATKELYLSNSGTGVVSGAGLGTTSFVNGPLNKNIAATGSFVFPVGFSNSYRPVTLSQADADVWQTQAYSGGYNATNFVSPIGAVSTNEYWRIKSVTSTKTAKVSLPYNTSGIASKWVVVNYSDLNLWNNDLGSTINTASTSVVTNNAATFNAFAEGNYFAVGSSNLFEWRSNASSGSYSDWANANNWSTALAPTATDNVKISPLTVDGTHEYPVISGGTPACFNLTLDASALLTITGGTLNVSGNWTNNGTFTASSGAVSFVGTGAQSIGGNNPSAFYDLVVNNTAAAGADSITLNADVAINHSLTLTHGIIKSSATNLLTFNDNATSGAGSSLSFVDGPIEKIGDEPFTFPTGDESFFASLGMVGLSNFDATTSFTCAYFRAGHSDQTNVQSPIDHISKLEYWDLSRNVDPGNNASCNVALGWSNADSSGIKNLSLLVAHYNSVTPLWENMGGSVSGALGAGSGTVTSTTPLTSFSPITIATTLSEAANPLPVELLYFKANPTLTQVDLYWSTASELNNDYFEVQRSTNGRDFTVIGKVGGNGTTHLQNNYTFTDNSPISGTSYYRLKQVDFNNEFEIHKMVAVNFEGAGSDLGSNQIKVFPNPYQSGQLDLEVKAFEAATPIELAIYDVTGKVVYRVGLTVPEDQTVNLIPQAMNQLNKGVYIVQVHNGTSRFTQKMVIE